MMARRWRGWLISLCVVGMLLAGKTSGESVAIQPSADTALFAGGPDNNLGANGNFIVGGNGGGVPGRGLLRFNVAGAIPSNAVIQSVALSFKVVVVASGAPDGQAHGLRRVFVNWAEGIGTGNTGSAANTGEVTWNNRSHPSTPWTQPGGAISNDFSATLSASMLLSNVGSYTFLSTSNLVADVQQWLANPATNFGWVLISEVEASPFTARRIGSRENVGNEPALTIQYTLPPDIFNVALAGNRIRFSFNAESNRTYAVEFRDSLTTTNWSVLTNIPVQVANTTLHITNIISTADRFFRTRTP